MVEEEKPAAEKWTIKIKSSDGEATECAPKLVRCSLFC